MQSCGKTRSMSTSQESEINVNNNKELTFLRLRNVSRRENYGVRCGNRPLISILFSRIHWLSFPDLTLGLCSWQPSSKPVRSIRQTTLKSKISSMSTIETRPFWLYSYIFWKAVFRNNRYMCIILVANIIWCSGHAIRFLPLKFLFSPPWLLTYLHRFYVTAV